MTHGSLFSGIGGFELAAQWMRWENLFHCEINEFGQQVLKHYWPKSESFTDITKTNFKKYANKIDVLTGGFPCQPYSVAGKRKGKEDDRHLWPEMLRAIREIQPTWVVGENVRGLINWSNGLVFEEVQTDLETEGYQVQPFLLPAASVNAPHQRERIWFVAYSNKCATRSSRTSGETESDRSKNNDEQESRRQQAEQHIGCSNVFRFATDTNRKSGKQKTKREREVIRQKRDQLRSNITAIDESKSTTNTKSSSSERQHKQRQRKGEPGGCHSKKHGNATHTNGIGYPSEEYRATEARQYSQENKEQRWENFPTQSPICSRNDGISNKLDNITFPKWRNESIKAYGNAIVPQLVYEIFKAIEKNKK